jgi:hypothetical protein
MVNNASDPLQFVALLSWISKQPKTKNLNCKMTMNLFGDVIAMTLPNIGTSCKYDYKGTKFWVTLKGENGVVNSILLETYFWKKTGWDMDILRFMFYYESSTNFAVFTQKENSWEFNRRKPLRKQHTLILDGSANNILKEAMEFFSQETENKYLMLGIPYRKTYLLYGPPGNNK